MMTADEVAARHDSRPGFRLIDFREVALPFYSVATHVLVLARKRTPVIDEFLLRAIALGLDDPSKLARFYGLDERIVSGALASLYRSEDIHLATAEGTRTTHLALTSKGRVTVESLESIVPEQRVLQVPFDGVLRVIRDYPRVPMMTPAEVRNAGFLAIPPTKVAKPEIADITAEAVDGWLRQTMGSSDVAREVLAVRRVARKDRKYRPAVGLLYEAEGGGEYQLAFAIDGILSHEHENAFAASGGPAKLKIADAIRASRAERDEELQRVLDETAVGDDIEIRHEASTARREIEAARTELRAAEGGPEIAELQTRIASLEIQLADLEKRKERMATRNLYTHDHPPLLRKAITSAQRRLLIISPWMKRDVVDDEFRLAVEELLKRGVEFYLGYGLYRTGEIVTPGKSERFFENLARRYKNLHLREFGNTHAKVLLVDDEFVVHTSFNWLSFRGDPDRTFRDEQGVLVADPEQVEKKFQELVVRF